MPTVEYTIKAVTPNGRKYRKITSSNREKEQAVSFYEACKCRVTVDTRSLI